MRPRSAWLALALILVGIVNLISFLDFLTTRMVGGTWFDYLYMVVYGVSALACLIAVWAILDRRTAKRTVTPVASDDA